MERGMLIACFAGTAVLHSFLNRKSWSWRF